MSSVGRVFVLHAQRPRFGPQKHIKWAWEDMPGVLGLRRQRQEDDKFRVILGRNVNF